MARKLPDLDYLKSILNYNPDTGIFTWKVARGRVSAGTVAGQGSKYIRIRIDKVSWLAHRLAWYISTGDDPGSNDIDHINRDSSDNRLCNLRACDRSTNCLNKTYKGKHFTKKGNKYASQIKIKGVTHYCGLFDTPEEAQQAARSKAG